MAAQRQRAAPKEEGQKERDRRQRRKGRAAERGESGNMYLMRLRHFINSHFHVGHDRARESERQRREPDCYCAPKKKWALFVESERTFRKDSP